MSRFGFELKKMGKESMVKHHKVAVIKKRTIESPPEIYRRKSMSDIYRLYCPNSLQFVSENYQPLWV